MDFLEAECLTSRTKIESTVEIIAKTTAPIKAEPALSTLNDGIIQAAKYKITAFTTNVKSPNVKRLIGAVIKISKGLVKVLISPITKAAITAVQKLSILNPSTTLEVIINASAFKSRAIK